MISFTKHNLFDKRAMTAKEYKHYLFLYSEIIFELNRFTNVRLKWPRDIVEQYITPDCQQISV